jgi:uncharacterized protein (TIGR00297 family)
LNRLTSYGFIFALIVLSILEGDAADHYALFQGLVFSLMIAYSSFIFTWITIDAVLPVIILGTIIFGFGGWVLTIAVIVFFITGSLLTRFNRDDMHSEKQIGHEVRRDGVQIWANGFWLAVFCSLWFMVEIDGLLIAAFSALSVATADTWATEIGLSSSGKTFNLSTGHSVEPGTNGGVSIKGTFFSFLGALLIGFFASQAMQLNVLLVLSSVTVAGFLGSLIDSYIGAIYQNGPKKNSAFLNWSELSDEKKNSVVNWLSTGSGGIIALLFFLIV